MTIVSVIASPLSVTTAWQNTDAQASVSCNQPLGSCDANTYRILVYYSSPPGTCPTDYNSYTLSSPQTISSHAWVCAAAKDTTGDAGFSPSPVEFLVEKIPPTGTISIDNGALYTTSSSVTLISHIF
jgi:hypothetical protein